MKLLFLFKVIFCSLLLCIACSQQAETSSSQAPPENTSTIPEEETPATKTQEVPTKTSRTSSLEDLSYTGFPYGFLGGSQVVFNQEKVDTIPIYDGPEGKIVSQLTLFFRGQVEGGLALQPEGVDFSDYEATKNQQYYKTGYDSELIYLNYYTIKNGFVQILAKDHNSYWLDYRDIEEYFKPIRFIEDITARNGWQVFGYENYRLREAPHLNGKIIVKLSESKHVIKKFSRIEGNWAEALIYEINKPLDDCYSDEDLNNAMTGKTYTGWIRVVDEYGQVSDINFYSSC